MARAFSFGGVVSGQIFQTGVLVPDVDASMQFYAEALRVGPFTCNRDFRAPDGWYRGGTDMPHLTIAHSHTGSTFIEFIQQHDDTPSVYKEFLEKYGYGLHHYGIAVAPEDYDKTLEHYFSLGFENVFTDNLPTGARIRYIGPRGEAGLEKLHRDIGVCYFELVEITPAEETFFTQMYNASREWDGKTLLRAR